MFRTIPEFPNYQASNVGGEIRGIKGGRRSGAPLKHNFSHGYHYVGLYRDGKIWRVKVHRLVLAAWRGSCPDGMEGLHKDDDKDNNDLPNLYWGTKAQNGEDATRNGIHRRAQCPQQHPLDERNIGISIRNGKAFRWCRQCALDRNRKIKGVTSPRGLYRGKGGMNYVE